MCGTELDLLPVASDTTDVNGRKTNFHFRIELFIFYFFNTRTIPRWSGLYAGGRVSSVMKCVRAQRLDSWIGRGGRWTISNVESIVVKNMRRI